MYGEFREHLEKDRIIIAEGRLAIDRREENNGGRDLKVELRVAAVRSLAEERARYASSLTIAVDADEVDDRFRDFLRRVLSEAPGECPVRLRYRQGRQSASLELGPRWRVAPSEELLEELRRELGHDRIKLDFERSREERPAPEPVPLGEIIPPEVLDEAAFGA